MSDDDDYDDDYEFLQANRALYVLAAGLPTSCALDVALQSGQGLSREGEGSAHRSHYPTKKTEENT